MWTAGVEGAEDMTRVEGMTGAEVMKTGIRKERRAPLLGAAVECL
jgi:hypothetical protein